MKLKLLLIAVVVLLAFGASSNASAQWVELSGLHGNDLTCLAAIDTTIFAGAYYSGIFRSSDSGSHWNSVDSGLTDMSVTALLTDGNQLFAGTSYGGVYPSTDEGIYLSTDKGYTWKASGSGLTPNSDIYSMTLINSNLFAGNYAVGVFLSTNAGTSWATESAGLGHAAVSHIVASGPDLFAGTAGNGVYMSNDNGSSWSEVNNGLPFDTVNGYSFVGAFAASPTRVFEGGIGGGVYFTTNEGALWIEANNGLTNDSVSALAVNGTSVFAGTVNGEVFFMKDSGSSWINVSTGIRATDGIVCFLASGSNLFAGTTNGIYRRPLSDFNNLAVTPVTPVENSFTTYPNPFTESTTITFTTPGSGVAEVSVVNLLGTEVARIFSGELSAGDHTFTWNATGLPDGMYECIVRMNGQVKRVTAIKK
jgi:photosystem II stability/assembly factor-like uncharacterized protein